MLRHLSMAAAFLAILGLFAPGRAEEKEQIDDSNHLTNSIGMKLVLIPAGEFMMGSSESQEDIAAFFNNAYGVAVHKASDFNGELPQHRVRITKPFYLGMYDITRQQFKKFIDESKYKTDAEKSNKGALGFNPAKQNMELGKDYSWQDPGFDQKDDHPVVLVSWNDAMAFCRWLSKKENRTYRLPTQAEWEYACRAGTKTRFYNGDDVEELTKVANIIDAKAKEKFPTWGPHTKSSDGYVYTSPVGSFQPNTFGLYDMHGNVWQWCMDWYAPDYYRVSPVTNPTGPTSGKQRVVRGGCWGVDASNARSSKAGAKEPNYADPFHGFRVALVVDALKAKDEKR
jgi:formylglycine-generating enzyme